MQVLITHFAMVINTFRYQPANWPEQALYLNKGQTEKI